MTIEEARKVGNMARVLMPHDPHKLMMVGARAYLAKTFPEFSWDIRGWEFIPFERAEKWFADVESPSE